MLLAFGSTELHMFIVIIKCSIKLPIGHLHVRFIYSAIEITKCLYKCKIGGIDFCKFSSDQFYEPVPFEVCL